MTCVDEIFSGGIHVYSKTNACMTRLKLCDRTFSHDVPGCWTVLSLLETKTNKPGRSKIENEGHTYSNEESGQHVPL